MQRLHSNIPPRCSTRGISGESLGYGCFFISVFFSLTHSPNLGCSCIVARSSVFHEESMIFVHFASSDYWKQRILQYWDIFGWIDGPAHSTRAHRHHHSVSKSRPLETTPLFSTLPTNFTFGCSIFKLNSKLENSTPIFCYCTKIMKTWLIREIDGH